MIVEDTKDLVETADYVIIEAVLVDDGLRYKQLSVGIKAKNGDIIRIIPISTMLMKKRPGSSVTARSFSIPRITKYCNEYCNAKSFLFSLIFYTSGNLA